MGNGLTGSGKTVFVVSLLKKQQVTFLWYQIDISENNFADIFYFLALAAQKYYPGEKLKLPIFTAEYGDDVEGFCITVFLDFYTVFPKKQE
ncbi:hypothetical protein SAMN05421863_100348 [Nitrosomonas communis]|uniref:Uncharacterized protein n=2 Tax=Nitrosomonas communis TaxID=44574 RepID=A0A1I4K079_9PROT|nr:hypothetical protein SAMN05421863_100348 [Nitrosomonas communis]